MRHFIRAVYFITLILCLSGCSMMSRSESFKNRMNNWVGKSSDALIKEWGNPTSSYDLANGEKTFEYLKERGMTNRDSNIWRGGNFFPDPLEQASIECVVRFIINQDGQIIRWTSNTESEICY